MADRTTLGRLRKISNTCPGLMLVHGTILLELEAAYKDSGVEGSIVKSQEQLADVIERLLISFGVVG